MLGQLARRLGVAESWERDRRCVADLALASLGDAQLVLLRPRRLMNANGRSVARAGELRAAGMGRPAGRAQGPEGIMGCGSHLPPGALLSSSCCMVLGIVGASVSLYVKWG